jgi:hypothetical protein
MRAAHHPHRNARETGMDGWQKTAFGCAIGAALAVLILVAIG